MLEFKDNPCLILKQFFSFAAVGMIGTVFHYIVLVCAVSGFQVKPLIGSMVGFLVGATVNYLGNYYITFKSDKAHIESSIKFFLIALSGFVINAVIMITLPLVFNFHYLIDQSIATILILFWNFSGNKLWTFSETERLQ